MFAINLFKQITKANRKRFSEIELKVLWRYDISLREYNLQNSQDERENKKYIKSTAVRYKTCIKVNFFFLR